MHPPEAMTNSWSAYALGALTDLRVKVEGLTAAVHHTNMRVSDMREDLHSRMAAVESRHKPHSRWPRVIMLTAMTTGGILGHADPAATRKLLLELLKTLLLGH